MRPEHASANESSRFPPTLAPSLTRLTSRVGARLEYRCLPATPPSWRRSDTILIWRNAAAGGGGQARGFVPGTPQFREQTGVFVPQPGIPSYGTTRVTCRQRRSAPRQQEKKSRLMRKMRLPSRDRGGTPAASLRRDSGKRPFSPRD